MRRFRAKKNDYLLRDEMKIRSTWHPQIKVDNQWCYLPDDSTPSKLVEAIDEETATELAIHALRAERSASSDSISLMKW